MARRLPDWSGRLHPQGLARRPAGWALAVICALLLLALAAIDLRDSGPGTVGALSVLPVIAAAWLLDAPKAGAVVLLALLGRCALFVTAGIPVLTFGSQIAVIVTAAVAAQLASTSIVSASELRAGTRQAALSQAILDDALDAVITINESGLIEAWNPQAELMFGRRREEVLGRVLSELIVPSGLRSAHDAGLAHFRATGETPVLGQVLTVSAVARDGGEFPVELAISRGLQTPGGTTFTAFVRDISERQRSQERIQDALARAEEASRAKTEYLSRMSHELRTPLSAVLGFAELMRLEEPRPDQVRSLDTILKAGNHLLVLIDELLDISRIESGADTLSLEPVALQRSVEESIELVSMEAAERNITITVGPIPADAMVMADRHRLKQVILNLLSNAIKYNRVGGQVEVSVAADQERSRLLVQDTGPGLAPDLLPRLFQPFERLGAERTTIPGTGLGLALCHRLMGAMQGSIEVVSPPGAGLTVTLELATAAVDTSAPAEVPASGDADYDVPVPACSVLYIEDNLANVDLVTRILGHRPGMQVVPAMQGGLGLELAKQTLPALILLDVHLPDLDGEEVLRRLLADPLTHGIPVVMLSADATTGRVERLLAQGAAAYLTKPIRPADLLSAVDRLLADRLNRVADPDGVSGSPGR